MHDYGTTANANVLLFSFFITKIIMANRQWIAIDSGNKSNTANGSASFGDAATFDHDTGNYWGAEQIAAPSLTATPASATSITLTWTAVDDAIRYTYERSTDQVNWTNSTTALSGTGTTIGGLIAGTTYYFRIKSQTQTEDSEWSNIASATPSGTVPTPPSAPNQVIVDETTVTPTSLFAYWIAAAGATNYVLEASTSGVGNWIVKYSGPETSVTVTGMIPTSAYFLRVKAQNAAGDSAWSGITHVMPRGYPAPTDLAVTRISHNAVDLEWNAVGDPPGHVVAWSSDGGNHWMETTTGPQQSASVTGLTPNTTYQFRVKSRHGAIDYPWSGTVETTTLPAPKPESPTESLVIVKRITQKYAVKTAFLPHSL